MADQFGYNLQFADKPGMWDVDGYAVITNGSGNAVIVTNQLNTQGVLAAVQSNAPSSAVHDITRVGTGQYKIHLNQTWVQLEHVDVKSIIDPSLSPAYVGCQVQKITVANSSYGPGQSELQYVQIQFNVSGTPTELPQGAGFVFRLRLKNSSA